MELKCHCQDWKNNLVLGTKVMTSTWQMSSTSADILMKLWMAGVFIHTLSALEVGVWNLAGFSC